jgi:CheY-like chemotaxis protein
MTPDLHGWDAVPTSPPAPNRDAVPLRQALAALGTRLRAVKRHIGNESPAAEEIHAAIGATAAIRRLLGLELAAPVVDSPVPARALTSAPSAASNARQTILLIDDEAQVRAPLSVALQRQGFHVLQATDGDEGLELIARRGSEIALVVVDHRMPRVSGAEVLRQVRQRPDHLPVVLMSGQNTLVPAVDADRPDAFLLKPFQLVDLARTVQRLLGPEVTASD